MAKQFVVKAVQLETDPAFNLPTEGRDILSRDASAQVVSRFNRISTDVKKLVADNWPAIERTAEELLRLSIISGEEVDAIIGKRKPCHA